MGTDLRDSKVALRERMSAELASISPARRSLASAQARVLLLRQPVGQRAGSILFFAPTPAELDIWPLLAEALVAGKTVALPRFDLATRSYIGCEVRELEKELAPGRFGIREPLASCQAVPLNRLDLALVPG